MVAVVVVEVLVLVVVVAVAVVVVVLALVLMLAGVVQGIADIGLLTRFKVLNGVLWGVTVVVLTKLLELTSVVVVVADVADEVVVVVVIIVDVVVAVVVACACIVGAKRTQCLEWAHDHTHKLAKTATELALCIEPLAHSSSFGAQS